VSIILEDHQENRECCLHVFQKAGLSGEKERSAGSYRKVLYKIQETKNLLHGFFPHLVLVFSVAERN
jgi:hypothetical protein